MFEERQKVSFVHHQTSLAVWFSIMRKPTIRIIILELSCPGLFPGNYKMKRKINKELDPEKHCRAQVHKFMLGVIKEN
jgi:hypothetical protein